MSASAYPTIFLITSGSVTRHASGMAVFFCNIVQHHPVMSKEMQAVTNRIREIRPFMEKKET